MGGAGAGGAASHPAGDCRAAAAGRRAGRSGERRSRRVAGGAPRQGLRPLRGAAVAAAARQARAGGLSRIRRFRRCRRSALRRAARRARAGGHRLPTSCRSSPRCARAWCRWCGRWWRAAARSTRRRLRGRFPGFFPMEAQRQLGTFVAAEIGFDWSAGRLDRSAHPFCTGIARRDVRLTWRGQEEDLRQALMGVLHEMGHGLYDQGLPAEWESTPLGEPASTGVHESQSRLWEILVGRGRPFWRWLLPHVRQAFPGYAPGLEQVWPALHAIKPTLIRVEADEATYNLHVLVRFELERALFGGDLQVADLPAAWDDLYAEVLGLAAARRRAGRAAGPALGGGAVRLLPDLHARHAGGGAAVRRRARAARRPRRPARRAESSRRCSAGCAIACTATAPATRRASCSPGRRAPSLPPSPSSPTSKGSPKRSTASQSRRQGERAPRAGRDGGIGVGSNPGEGVGWEGAAGSARGGGVDVVVPVYGAAADLARCLRSVVAHSELGRHRLVVVLDGPQEAAVEEAQALLAGRGEAEAIVLRQPERRGFAAAVNRGIAVSDRDVVLLNSDTQVTAGWLDKLRRAAASAPEVGTVTPLSNHATICSLPRFLAENTVPAGHDVDSFAALVERVAVRAAIRGCPPGVGFCLSCGDACSTAVGGLDEERFGLGYGEETDLCMRATAAGFVHLLDDATYVWHRGQGSFGGARATRVRRAERRMRHLHPGYLPAVADFIRRDPLAAVRERAIAALALPTRRGPADCGARTRRPSRPRLAAVLDRRHRDVRGGSGATAGAAPRRRRVRARGAARPSYRRRRRAPRPRRARPLHVNQFDQRDPLARNALDERRQRRAFARFLDQERPHLLHVHHLAGHVATLVRVAARRGVPVVFQLQDWWQPCARVNLLHRDGYLCPGPTLATLRRLRAAHPAAAGDGVEPRCCTRRGGDGCARRSSRPTCWSPARASSPTATRGSVGCRRGAAFASSRTAWRLPDSPTPEQRAPTKRERRRKRRGGRCAAASSAR